MHTRTATDGNTYDRQLQLLDCASVLRAIIRVTQDGKYTVLADHFEGNKFNSPNDVVIGPDGAIYFTDPTLDLSKEEKQDHPAQKYAIRRDSVDRGSGAAGGDDQRLARV